MARILIADDRESMRIALKATVRQVIAKEDGPQHLLSAIEDELGDSGPNFS